jgi:hypothetical protein
MRLIGPRIRIRAWGPFLLLFGAMAVMGLPQANSKVRPAAQPVYWWLGASLGAGAVSGGTSEGLVLGCLDLTVQKGKMFVSLRGTAGLNPDDDRTSVGEVDLVIGYFKRKARSAWSYGAGIGYVDMYPPSKPPFKGLSLPLEVRYSWFFSRAAALTASGLLNFSGGATYFGVTAGIQLGRIHPRGA